MKSKKSAYTVGEMQRHILVGAGIGLYYGLFYRPSSTDPDYGIAIVLSILAALVTVVIRFWGKKLPFSTMLRGYFETLVFFGIFLIGLVARKTVEQVGGRFAVTLFTTFAGIGLGYFMATRKKLI